MRPRLIEAGVIALIAAGLYVLVALFSYHPGDPSWANTNAFDSARNLAGGVGSWLAYTLFFIFGAIAYIFPLACFCIARDLFRPEERGYSHYVMQVSGFCLTAIGLCGLTSLHFAADVLPATMGGVVGHLTAIGFLNVFGLLGATLLLIALFAVSVPLATGYSWLKVFDIVGLMSLRLWRELSKLPERCESWYAGNKASKRRCQAVDAYKEKQRRKGKTKVKIEPSVKEGSLGKGKRIQKEKQMPLLDNHDGYALPPIDTLEDVVSEPDAHDKEVLENLAELLQVKLSDFGIDAKVEEVLPGPVITRMELSLAAGVKASRVSSLEKDLARALSLPCVRVLEVVPGKSVVGIELPNAKREMVSLKELVASSAYEKASSPLTLVLGKDIAGKPVLADLAKMPHLLVAGTTGAGKSVALHSMLMSMLFRAKPETLRLLLIDPKMLELSVYRDIPHLLTPVVTDVQEATNALAWVVEEMETRYRLMSGFNVRNIGSFNRKVEEAKKKGEPLMRPTAEAEAIPNDASREEVEALPYIVVVIDELADMIMTAGKNVEQMIARLAQKARAAGIHLILATQRPSVDVITGLIKANIPSRIAFRVSSKTDSRTIVDQNGAEQLLGQGDMLYLAPGTSFLERVHGAFVSDSEVNKVTDLLRESAKPDYIETVTRPPAGASGGGDGGEVDALFDEAVAIVAETQRASISYLQRRLRVGYNRAARLVEEMEAAQIIGPVNSNGTREIHVPPPEE